jgi:hypothetical protein
VFISVNDHHKPEAVKVANSFAALGFHLVATRGTDDDDAVAAKLRDPIRVWSLQEIHEPPQKNPAGGLPPPGRVVPI